METERLYEFLDIFLEKDVMAKVRDKLGKFHADESFMEWLGGNVSNKELRSLDIQECLPLIKVLDNVVLADYPIENPIEYCSLYRMTCGDEKTTSFSKVLSHLNQASNI